MFFDHKSGLDDVLILRKQKDLILDEGRSPSLLIMDQCLSIKAPVNSKMHTAYIHKPAIRTLYLWCHDKVKSVLSALSYAPHTCTHPTL